MKKIKLRLIHYKEVFPVKGNRKLLMLIVASLLMLGACSKDEEAEGGSEESLANLNEEGMPIVEESIELDVFAGKSATTADDWNDVLLLNEYKDMSNIDIKWNQVPADGLDEKRNLALASGDLPDAFYAANISIADLQKYGSQGTIVGLNDMIVEYRMEGA